MQLAVSNIDTTAAAAVVVTVYDQEGQPVPEFFDSDAAFEIPSLGNRVLRSTGVGEVGRGWIEVGTDTASVSGLLTYRNAGTGLEVSVGPTELGSHFALFVEESSGIGTGLAIFNPDPASRIVFRIHDEDGVNPLGEGFARAGDFSQAARTIPEWFAMDGIDTEFLANFRGLLFLRAEDGSSFAPIGLRFGKRGESLSSVPVIRVTEDGVDDGDMSSGTNPQIYNDNVFVLPVAKNVAALWTDFGNSPPLEDYVARFYEHFNDEFDFLIFIANVDFDRLVPGSITGAFYSSVKNDVQGIGLSIFSRNSSFGSAGKLQGVIFHSYDDESIFRGLLLHELMHRWGNFIVPTGYGPHWGFSTSGGYLGCCDISNMIDRGDGKFSAPNPFYFRSSEQYSSIELYLAGFIPPEEVPDFQTAEDGEWLFDERGYPVEDDNGYRMFTASGFKTHTIEDIIAEHGPRVPDHSQAQKDFRAAVILLVSEDYPATREILERFSDDVSWFSHAGKDESGPPVTNFHEATGGRGTITMGDLSQFQSRARAKSLAPSSFGTPPPSTVDLRE